MWLLRRERLVRRHLFPGLRNRLPPYSAYRAQTERTDSRDSRPKSRRMQPHQRLAPLLLGPKGMQSQVSGKGWSPEHRGD